MILGGHGDTMVPLLRYTTVGGIPVTELLDEKTLDAIVQRTKVGGGELVKLMGTSAWYAPGAAGATLVEAIIRDEKKIFPCCVLLEGEYGQNDICIGVPVVIGKDGVEEIVDYKLNAEEKALFEKSAAAVRKTNDILKEIKAL